MSDEQIKKIILEKIKDVKIRKGAILNKDFIEKKKEDIKKYSDDELLMKMTEIYGEFAFKCIRGESNPTEVMKIYVLAVAYFLIEEEAQNRELYW
jgi:hypothetical protein